MKGELLTLPNAVTLVRIAAIPFVIHAMAARQDALLVVWIVVVALSDFLDGFLARLLKAQSDIGKLLDPAADKVCVLALSIALVVYCAFPVWALAMLLAKDFLIAVGGMAITRKARLPITPNYWGKATLAVEMGAFVIYAFRVEGAKLELLVVLVFFVAVSFLVYAKVFYDVFAGRRSVDQIVASYSSYGLTRDKTLRARLTNLAIILLSAWLLVRFVWLLVWR